MMPPGAGSPFMSAEKGLFMTAGEMEFSPYYPDDFIDNRNFTHYNKKRSSSCGETSCFESRESLCSMKKRRLFLFSTRREYMNVREMVSAF